METDVDLIADAIGAAYPDFVVWVNCGMIYISENGDDNYYSLTPEDAFSEMIQKRKEPGQMSENTFTPDVDEEEPSKYPIADMGDDFQVDAMEDFDQRMNSGEFTNKTVEEIRSIYVQEEADAVERREIDDVHRQMDEDDQRRLDRELDGDDEDDD